MRPRALLLIVGLSLASLLLLDNASVWARAGSGGSRGSRSYSSPTTPSSPSSPSPVTTPSPSSPQQPMQRPGMFGGLMGGIAGFALGGLLGSMLFGGEGGGFGGGLGLLELLLIGGAVFFLFRMLRGRQAARPWRRCRACPTSTAGSSTSVVWTRASITTASPNSRRRRSVTSRAGSSSGT